MSDLLSKEKNDFKQKTTHFQIEEYDNPPAFAEANSGPVLQNQNRIKSDAPVDIFKHVEAYEGMFDLLINENKDNPKLIKKKQKDFLKEHAHEESDKFSLYNSLGGDPDNILFWLKNSAAIDGASDSFKDLIASFEKMMSVPSEATVTASFEVLNMANAYLSSHRKSPVHLYGRQRVSICKEIINHISELPLKASWKKVSDNKDALPIPLDTTDTLINQHQTENNPAGEEERRRELNKMVDELVAVTEDEINKFVNDPVYYQENIYRLGRLNDIAKFLDSSDDAFDKEFMKKVPGYLKNVVSNRINLIQLTFKLTSDLSQGNVEELGTKKAEFDAQIKNTYVRNGEKERSIWNGKGEMTIDEKVDSKLYKYFMPGSEQKLHQKASDIYNKVNAFAGKYYNKENGVISLPSPEEAINVLSDGSLEEKYALYMVYETAHINVLSNANNKKSIVIAENNKLREEYENKIKEGKDVPEPEYKKVPNPAENVFTEDQEAIYELISDILDKTKEAGEPSDSKGFSEDDSIELGFIGSLYNTALRENLYGDIHNQLEEKKYSKDTTEEQIREDRNKIIENKTFSMDGLFYNHFGTFRNASYDASAKISIDYSNIFISGNQAFAYAQSNSARYKDYFEKFSNNQKSLKLSENTISTLQKQNYAKKEGEAQDRALINSKKAEFMSMLDTKVAMKQVPFISKKMDMDEINSIVKRDLANTKSIPQEINYKKLKHNKKADQAAVERAKTKFTVEGELNEIYGAASETLVDASVKWQRQMEYYFRYAGGEGLFSRDIRYFLCYLQLEDYEKKEEDLTPEELKVRKWNQAFARNYYAYKKNDEQGLNNMNAMMQERMEDLVRLEIKPENLMDGNWIVKNFSTLEAFTTICGYLNNVEEYETQKNFIENLKKQPYYELLSKKIRIFSLINMLIYNFRPALGIFNNAEDAVDYNSYFMSQEMYIEDQSSASYGDDGPMGVVFDNMKACLDSLRAYKETLENFGK